MNPNVMQAPHSLLMGPPGSGKTTSLATYAKAGVDVFAFITEPTGVDSLYDAWEREKLSIERLHYVTITPSSGDWKALIEMGQKIQMLGYKDLSELKSGIGKEHMKQYIKMLQNLQNFCCERSQKEYGDVTSWDASRALCMDSLSGTSIIAMQQTVGLKPSPHQGEWGIAMSAVEQLLLKLSSDCRCFFTVTAHLEKEPDELTGVSKVAVSTLGRKLAPKIPRFFSEVIRARKDPSKNPIWRWSTLDSEADLKNRALPASNDLLADFTPIVEAYRRRVKASQAPVPAPAA